MEYRIEYLENEDGRTYGEVYHITPAEGQSFIDAQQQLIAEVIGEEHYYGPSSVWEQVHIKEAK